MLQMTLHVGIKPAGQPRIPIRLIDPIRNQYRTIRPARGKPEVLMRGRRHLWKGRGIQLAIYHVLIPFAQEAFRLRGKHARAHDFRAVAPAHAFVALRTIGGDLKIVGPHRPKHVRVSVVDQIIRTLKGTDLEQA